MQPANALAALRPFVYRRYLDYGALDGLRTMKAAIAAEVARKELADDIKRGPGGIREIEFLVQALQLIRGGRELRAARTPPVAGIARAGADGSSGCRDGRRTGPRLSLPARAGEPHPDAGRRNPCAARRRTATERRARLGHADMSVLDTELAGVRSYVASEFAGLLAPRKAVSGDSDLSLYWRSLPDDGEASSLASAGFEAGDDLHRSLCDSPARPACASYRMRPARGWIACYLHCCRQRLILRNRMRHCAACCRCCTPC